MIVTKIEPTEGQTPTVNGTDYTIEGVTIEPGHRSPSFGNLPLTIRVRLHTGENRWFTLCGQPESGEYIYMLVGSNVLNEIGYLR